jgi:hypothetical protein
MIRSLSTDDPAAAEAIRLAARASDATELGAQAHRKDGWPGVRLKIFNGGGW